ncbi:hypothetical protein P9G84_14945 [Brevibacillus centrosporus]|uniref:hypothetical protein n=1 Tax=Brevibacillus centrosporus TaxID=54910 RepID=UPI000F0A0DBE|nr:hypothetical protein [Brevibacillus centrosporus]MEC2130244.1 hypothetical protein [Brevibacillus centrosporus]RNB70960.1 hypothetical protein EDM55_09250 [Brevibacillus centrosporus]GED30274.1 hypothetical protein BCE02nite_14150 [Brevibacillus centrosporus]
MKKAVGFDQKIQLHQLDFIANEISRMSSRDVLYQQVDEQLMADIGGAKSRANARTILFKIWFLVPDEHMELRDRALDMFQRATPEEKLVLHWGMCLLAYPFFKDTIEQLGYLFHLQDEVTSEQIGRKMKGLYGERRRVEVSVNAVLSSIRSWGVLEMEKRNTHTIAVQINVFSTDIKKWLVQVMLIVTGKSVIELNHIAGEPCIFPFELSVLESELSGNELEITRQGVGRLMVGLK